MMWDKLVDHFVDDSSKLYLVSEGGMRLMLQNDSKALRNFHDRYKFSMIKKSLIGKVTSDRKDLMTCDQHYLHIESDLPKENIPLAAREFLAKVYAFRNLKRGDTITVPYVREQALDSEMYVVDRIFNLWKQIKAFGLRPVNKKKPAILLFRGTDVSLNTKSSRMSVMSNFDPMGPGFRVYMHARERINRWHEFMRQSSEKCIAVGFSQGASLGIYATIKDSQYFSKKYRSYFFNYPGLHQDLMNEWFNKQERCPYEAFVAQRDLVSKYGLLLPNTKIAVFDKPLPPIEAHTTLFSLYPQCHIQEVDQEKENKSESRKKYSKAHERIGQAILSLSAGIFFPF